MGLCFYIWAKECDKTSISQTGFITLMFQGRKPLLSLYGSQKNFEYNTSNLRVPMNTMHNISSSQPSVCPLSSTLLGMYVDYSIDLQNLRDSFDDVSSNTTQAFPIFVGYSSLYFFFESLISLEP